MQKFQKVISLCLIYYQLITYDSDSNGNFPMTARAAYRHIHYIWCNKIFHFLQFRFSFLLCRCSLICMEQMYLIKFPFLHMHILSVLCLLSAWNQKQLCKNPILNSLESISDFLLLLFIYSILSSTS